MGGEGEWEELTQSQTLRTNWECGQTKEKVTVPRNPHLDISVLLGSTLPSSAFIWPLPLANSTC
jgi:hypothetical protein